jgi:hypothetical protein
MAFISYFNWLLANKKYQWERYEITVWKAFIKYLPSFIDGLIPVFKSRDFIERLSRKKVKYRMKNLHLITYEGLLTFKLWLHDFIDKR